MNITSLISADQSPGKGLLSYVVLQEQHRFPGYVELVALDVVRYLPNYPRASGVSIAGSPPTICQQ